MRISDWSSDVCSSDLRELVLAAGLAHHARAGAVAAVGRAEAGGEEEDAVRVAMHQAGRLGVVVLAQGIVSLAGRTQVLLADRDVRAAQRLLGVVAAHQTGVVGRDADRQRALVARDGAVLVVGALEDPDRKSTSLKSSH